jgi:hypothetical protein
MRVSLRQRKSGQQGLALAHRVSILSGSFLPNCLPFKLQTFFSQSPPWNKPILYNNPHISYEFFFSGWTLLDTKSVSRSSKGDSSEHVEIFVNQSSGFARSREPEAWIIAVLTPVLFVSFSSVQKLRKSEILNVNVDELFSFFVMFSILKGKDKWWPC